MMVANAPVSAQCGGTVTGPVGAISISFSGGTVLPSPNNTCTVSVDVAVAAGGTYNNTSGKVSSTNGGTNNGSSGIATATLTAIAPPTITKAFSPTAVVVFNGVLTPNVDVSTLTFTLTNGNSSQLTGVGFTDNLPAGVAVANPPSVNANLTNCGVSDFSPAAAAGATTLTFSNGVIPANSACTISVNVIATTAGTFDNTTSAITSTEGGTGATSNTAILTSNPTADLSLAKTSKDAKGNLTPDVDPGETITYTIVVNNSGPSNVTGAAVSDTIPSSLTGVSWTCAASAGASCASGTNTGNISDTVNIPNGGSLTYTITATVWSTDTTDVINTATVTPPSGVTDTNPGNNSATVVDHLNLLSITKTPSTTTYSAAGTVINYSYTITNVGTSTLTNLSATDNPLGTLTCNSVPASFAPTDSFTCSAFYTTTQGDLDADKTISNSATVSGKDKEGDTVTATSNTVTVTASQTTGLTLTKSVSTISGTSPHQAGDVITYSYVLKNTGNVTLTGTDLTTQEFTIADDHIGAPLGTAFTCGTVISLAPNASITCTATYAIAQTDLDNGGVTNKATGYATFQSTPVTSKQVSLTTPFSESSALSLTKTPSPSAYAYVGDVITYTYTLKNTGNVTLAGADSTTHEFTITDDHIGTPLGTAFTCGTVTSLAPNATVMCTNTYDIVSSDLTDGSVTNQATGHAMSGTTPVDASPVKATATAQLATITGTVFDDVNTNGNQDANETGIAGVTVDLYDSTGTTLIATTTTDQKVTIHLSSCQPRITQLWKKTSLAMSARHPIQFLSPLPNGTAQANFGDYQIAGCSTNSITGVVFVDANDNGVFDAGEQGIPGVTVTLEDQNNHVVASTTTASNGSYSFNNISAGLYTVVETNLPGYFSTTLDHVGVAISCNTSDVVNYGDLQGTETFTGDPAVSKYGDPSSATVGSLVTFTITVGNNGPNNAQNVNLTDTAPTFLDIISINILPNQNFPVTIAGDTFTIKFGTVTPQNYYIVTVVTRV